MSAVSRTKRVLLWLGRGRSYSCLFFSHSAGAQRVDGQGGVGFRWQPHLRYRSIKSYKNCLFIIENLTFKQPGGIKTPRFYKMCSVKYANWRVFHLKDYLEKCPHCAIWCHCVHHSEHGQENTAAIISSKFKEPWNHHQLPWTRPQLENLPQEYRLNGGKKTRRTSNETKWELKW